jgi:hypothetical protein
MVPLVPPVRGVTLDRTGRQAGPGLSETMARGPRKPIDRAPLPVPTEHAHAPPAVGGESPDTGVNTP